MSDAAAPPPAVRRRSRRIMPILAVGAALAGVAGGFFAVRAGLLDLLPSAAPALSEPHTQFVEVPPIIITLGPSVRNRHLRFSSQIEVSPDARAYVARMMPRILDVLNGYLRAVEPADIENPAAMVRLRAQMLRRVQMVVGHDRAIDLLITEFVLN